MELVMVIVLAIIAFAIGYSLGKGKFDEVVKSANNVIQSNNAMIDDLQGKIRNYEEMRATLDEKASNFLHEIESHKEQTKKETKPKKKGKKK